MAVISGPPVLRPQPFLKPARYVAASRAAPVHPRSPPYSRTIRAQRRRTKFNCSIFDRAGIRSRPAKH